MLAVRSQSKVVPPADRLIVQIDPHVEFQRIPDPGIVGLLGRWIVVLLIHNLDTGIQLGLVPAEIQGYLFGKRRHRLILIRGGNRFQGNHRVCILWREYRHGIAPFLFGDGSVQRRRGADKLRRQPNPFRLRPRCQRSVLQKRQRQQKDPESPCVSCHGHACLTLPINT